MSYFTRGTFSKNCRKQPSYTDYVVKNYAHSYYMNRTSKRKTGVIHTPASLVKGLGKAARNMIKCKTRYVYTRSS